MPRKKNRKPTTVKKPLDPTRLAHLQLDEWIRGEIVSDGHFGDELSPGGGGVIWLGKLQRTMVQARDLYKSEHSDMFVAKNGHVGIHQPKPKMYGHNGNLIIMDDNVLADPRTASTAVDSVRMQNRRGEWVPAVPLPFYGLKKRCTCGATFWRESSYSAHYALRHIVMAELPL